MNKAAQNPRSLSCGDCGKRYSKAEHLLRHERSHTGAKPFLCTDCGRQFSRQDSLSRHAKRHLRNGNPRNSSPAIERAPGSMASPSQLTPTSFDTPAVRTHHESEGVDNTNAEQMQNDARNSIGLGNPPVPTIGIDMDPGLLWPDSEDLFQTIMSDVNAWPIPLPLMTQSHFHSTVAEVLPAPIITDYTNQRQAEGSHQAVQYLSQLITNLSSNVTAEVESTGITSLFLDKCLHMFFTHFIPAFPVLHRPTFVFKDCTQPLLLNAIALGSLFLGPRDAIAKGEALWRLAHIAVATSWPNLLTHCGPNDACPGIQLVLTALLGQFYAILSNNKSLRTTSQVFHGLGFYWARHCGMYDIEEFSLEDIPHPEAPTSEKTQKWRVWAAREIQLRAILAHYILDGQIASYSGDTTCVRHATNNLRLPSQEATFGASTVEEWVSAVNLQQQSVSFREIFNSLFSDSGSLRVIEKEISYFATQVILEGLKSLVSDLSEAGGAAVGIPARDDIRRVLVKLYFSFTQSPNMSQVEISETLLRWHAICLEGAVDSANLCRNVCHYYSIEQHVFGGAKKVKPGFNIQDWVPSVDARRALIHAVAIQEITERLPLGRAYAIHIPSSLFAAAIVYSALSLAGTPVFVLPQAIDWADALISESELNPNGYMPTILAADQSDTKAFLRGEFRPSNPVPLTRNTSYDLNSVQKLLRCLSHQWGVSFEMVNVLDKLISSST